MSRLIAVDIETFDPDLHTKGDGSCRAKYDKRNRILCVGTYDGTTAKAYIPGTSEWQEFKDIMKDASINKVFHNGIYDLTWLYCAYDIEANGLLHDTMTRMTYIDEYAELSLDACCKYFNIQGKNKDETIEAWWLEYKDYLGFTKKSDKLWAHADYIWEQSKQFRDLMIKYNLQDCIATWNLYQVQEPKMQSVMSAYLVDVKLTPLIIKMKKVGVRIDLSALDTLRNTVEADWHSAAGVLAEEYDIYSEDVASGVKLGKRMNALGIHSPMKTATGRESWAVDALKRINHPVVAAIQEFKNYDAVLHKFLHGSLADSILPDGRIHCTFSPNKREDGGTVTGRFACSHPNLQQIPARDKEWGHSYGQDMRALFLPEEGCMLAALDYSQIEAVLLGHFAVGPQAEWLRSQLIAGVDLHNIVMGMTGITYRPVVKTFNYGCIYGMGLGTALSKNYTLFEKLAAKEGKSVETFAKEIYDNYHAKFPVIRDTMSAVQRAAKLQGYVKTIGGRYQHKPKPKFDPATGKVNDFIYKMLNKLIQGSAADILKFALLKAYEDGVFNVLTMHLTVHDENVVSVPFNKVGTEACVALQQIMNNSFKEKLRVPIKACCELGPNWGYWSGDIYEQMKQGNFDPAFFKKNYKETH